MSAAATVPARAVAPRADGGARVWRAPGAALLAFAALALLAALRFAALLSHPPTLRVLGIVLTATAMGAALALTAGSAHRRLAAGWRIALLLLGAYLSLRLAGMPVRLLWPWRWPALAHQLGHGLDALDGLWPYDGRDGQARRVVVVALAGALIGSAALVFWPSAEAGRARLVGALTVLLGVYLTAAVNQHRVGWQLQGVMLLGLLCLWGWAWWPRLQERGRALAWLAVGTVLALIGSGLVQSSRALIDVHDWNPFGRVYPAQRFDWNQTYGPRTWPSSNEAMVEVASGAPRLWRATTLDRFDGVRFLRSSTPPAGTSGLAGVSLERRWVQRATYTVRGLSSAQLLSPGTPLGLAGASPDLRRAARLTPDGTLALSGAPPHSGARYTVIAYVPQPTIAALRAAPRGVPPAYRPYTELELPSPAGAGTPIDARTAEGAMRLAASPYAGVFALARRLAVGAHSDYELATRIEAYLSRGFTYDERPPQRRFPLVAFLLDDRRGYCQQFSGAMALLLRMDGVPARIAAGFKAGSRERRSGRLLVTAQDAHAWVEVYFAGIGWVAFDPTPAVGAGAPPAALDRSAERLGSSPGPGGATGSHGRQPDRGTAQPIVVASHAGSSAALVGTLVATIAVALLTLWWIIGRRRRGALDGEAAGALAELTHALQLLGVEVRLDTTLAELEARLQRSHGSEAAGYVRMLRERRYAPLANPRRPNERDRRLLRRALCVGRGPIARLRTLSALPPSAPWARGWRTEGHTASQRPA
jgi:transglutaminase-like putative cysteine protease